jgi:hypothetical protein
MDYAGPFDLALRTGRKFLTVKAYVALFVCIAAICIHVEWMSDLSTNAFLATFQRSISRQGCPSDLYNPQTPLTEYPSDCPVLN